MDDEENIKRLPVKFKHPTPQDRTLVRPWEVGRNEACDHWFGCAYIVDEKKSMVECGKCGTELSPMWVLSRLCSRDAEFHDAARRYKDEMARLSERSRTKCEWCDRLTRISRR